MLEVNDAEPNIGYRIEAVGNARRNNDHVSGLHLYAAVLPFEAAPPLEDNLDLEGRIPMHRIVMPMFIERADEAAEMECWLHVGLL
jgi:hypothetical protein